MLESFRTLFVNRAFICVMLVYLFSQLAIQFVQNNLFLWCKCVDVVRVSVSLGVSHGREHQGAL